MSAAAVAVLGRRAGSDGGNSQAHQATVERRAAARPGSRRNYGRRCRRHDVVGARRHRDHLGSRPKGVAPTSGVAGRRDATGWANRGRTDREAAYPSRDTQDQWAPPVAELNWTILMDM